MRAPNCIAGKYAVVTKDTGGLEAAVEEVHGKVIDLRHTLDNVSEGIAVGMTTLSDNDRRLNDRVTVWVMIMVVAYAILGVKVFFG